MVTPYSDNLPVNKEAGAICSALTIQWPALIADTNFEMYLDSFSSSGSVKGMMKYLVSPEVLFLTASVYVLWCNISTSSSAPHTLLLHKWLLIVPLLSANSFEQNMKDYTIWRLRLRLVTGWSRHKNTRNVTSECIYS